VKPEKKPFNIVFVSKPSESPAELNALAMGTLGSCGDLSHKLEVGVDFATLSIRTTDGKFVNLRLERSK
jgi:hypothetical protein